MDYTYVQNEFVIDQVVLKLVIKRLAIAMVNKTVVVLWRLVRNNPCRVPMQSISRSS
jgi:hypothetical protein